MCTEDVLGCERSTAKTQKLRFIHLKGQQGKYEITVQDLGNHQKIIHRGVQRKLPKGKNCQKCSERSSFSI